jgi:hypothetical protein
VVTVDPGDVETMVVGTTKELVAVRVAIVRETVVAVVVMTVGVVTV